MDYIAGWLTQRAALGVSRAQQMKWLAFRRIEHQTSFTNEVLPSESYRSIVFKMDVIRDSLSMFDLIPPMTQGQSEACPVT